VSLVLYLTSPDSSKLALALLATLATGALTVVGLVIKNWCKLLAGTIAVLHRDERRRADARLVYERATYGPDGLGSGPVQALPASPRPRRRRRRRRLRR
jgi:hypothetical protein